MRFPHYDYDDMVEAQRRMLERLGVRRLRLIMGTSMGCMHIFVWAETHPDVARAMMPMACLPTEIAGHNRMWRQLAVEGIRPTRPGPMAITQPSRSRACAPRPACSRSPAWPRSTCSTPIRRASAAEAYIVERVDRDIATRDANDLIYQLEASRNYNPLPRPRADPAPITWVNSADDFINPPDYGIAEPAARRMPSVRYVLIPRERRDARAWDPHLGAVLEGRAGRSAAAEPNGGRRSLRPAGRTCALTGAP